MVHGGGHGWCVVVGRWHCGPPAARTAHPECGYAECAMYTRLGKLVTLRIRGRGAVN
jgi:hypothetical protein